MIYQKHLILFLAFYFSSEVSAIQSETALPKFPQKQCADTYIDGVTSISHLGLEDLQVKLKWGAAEKILAGTGTATNLTFIWFTKGAYLDIGLIKDESGLAVTRLSALMERKPKEVYPADFEFDGFVFLRDFDKSRDIYYALNFTKREIYLAGFDKREKNVVKEKILILQPEEKRIAFVAYRYPGDQIEWLSRANLCPIKTFGEFGK
ncbi:hypothetical protein [Pseudidiomarina sp.]|uniref:hypothetical protein n=1 Tax=Pseudidiomarina sp. TaxID=2081707 RepID=UPI00299E316D|nr:hypothetical protein [Pseudidiomarina sp.]MDX1706616.1 hypothetical protein [Pseudidiomarina sp.]